MNKVSFFLARRFLHARSYDKNINIMLSISMATMIIGTCALALVAAIMHGFDIKTQTALKGLNPDLTIRSQKPLNLATITREVSNKFPQKIKGVTPLLWGYGMLENPAYEEKTITKIFAIDPTTIQAVMPLAAHIEPHQANLASQLSGRSVILGASLAERAGLNKGDACSLLYLPAEQSGARVTFDRIKLMVSGTLTTGIEEYDHDLIIMHQDLFEELFPNESLHTIGISLFSPKDKDALARYITTEFTVPVYSWEELYAPILSAMKLEKYVAIIVIALMFLIATSTIIALMFMFIASKKTDCAVLKALGMPTGEIRLLFIVMSTVTTTFATLSGIFIAAIASWALERFHLITIPDVYYVSYVPAHFTWEMALGIFVLSLFVSSIATWIPLSTLNLNSVMKLLKFE